MKRITHFYKLRTLCKTIANEPDRVVEGKEFDDRVRDVGVAAIESLRECIETLWEFVSLPHIAPMFDQWMESREED
jgi:hypothetical protein